MNFRMQIHSLVRRESGTNGYSVPYEVIAIEDTEFEILHTILLKDGRVTSQRFGAKDELKLAVPSTISNLIRDHNLEEREVIWREFHLCEGTDGNYAPADQTYELFVQHFGLDDEIHNLVSHLARQNLKNHEIVDQLFRRTHKPTYTNFGDWA